MKACVCDIGGTNFRIATYCDGELEDIVRLKTPNFMSFSESEIKERITFEIIREFTRRKGTHPELHILSVCFPGPVNKWGEVLGSSVIFGTSLQDNYRLKAVLQQQLPGTTILVVNDLTAAAYRYMGNGNFCLITVSSGIGNKISINDAVIIDAEGKTGEIGHFSTDNEELDITCTCGTGKNHVGMISSGRGIALVGKKFAREGGRLWKEYRESSTYSRTGGNAAWLTSEIIAAAADAGDVFARKIVDYCTIPLAHEICLLATALYLPRFILIGGFVQNCAYYLVSLKKNVKAKGIYNFSGADIEKMLVQGENDDDHSLIGAGILAVRLAEA